MASGNFFGGDTKQMNANPAIKVINNLIGVSWAFVGFWLFIGSLLWFVALFFKDAVQSLVGQIPLPNDMTDFLIIFTLLLIGFFFMSWGNAMLGRREWGSFAGGVVRLILAMHLVVAAIIFLQSPGRWLNTPATVSFYQRYYWLVWLIFGLAMLWLLWSTWLLLFSQGRRDYYALAYYNTPPPTLATCDKCGLILRESRCLECNRLERRAWLTINNRRKPLLFTEEKLDLVVGRQKDMNEADIVLSRQDTPQPERISARHARIRYSFAEEQFTVEDLGSMNKTFLNDEPEPLAPGKPQLLTHGDEINLARTLKLIFECEE